MIISGVKNKKIYIGLSGGVDSSVAAALLKKNGAQVIGVYIKGWVPPNTICSQRADRLDAMRVAAHLKIPF
ncbi:MAG TPA: tRNA 2-thiouridine(34) synthase MnmA, partial [Candidatus Vogelbacteria bacterium]|nr:tRNA 2-thiouridine(34) synthase MnmA [Candidatus Vogelbacteria bacterium]